MLIFWLKINKFNEKIASVIYKIKAKLNYYLIRMSKYGKIDRFTVIWISVLVLMTQAQNIITLKQNDNSGIFDVLLFGNIANFAQLFQMSENDLRNTLISDIGTKTSDSIPFI